MAAIYLTPDDINAGDTRAVLAFLNTVQTAEEIATRIEIPNEVDIGIKLGQRILDGRQNLGGEFSNLQELADLPLIGPERFTEVVTEVLKKSALEILNSNNGADDSYQVSVLAAQLEEALKKWASDFEHLNSNRYLIEIQSPEQTPYLGELIPLRIRLRDRITRKTKANVPVTLEINRGNLRWNKGLQLKQGSVITARTGVTGEIHCVLSPSTIEPLTELQQNKLSLALGKLPHDAAVPDEARESFLQLALLYQHPLNLDLRKAIDIHYKSHRDRVSETINSPASVYSWAREQVLVRVYVHPQSETEKNSVSAMSALTIEFLDWLSPWYQIYKENLLASGELQNELTQAFNYSEDEHGIVGHMISSVHSFIARQNGLIGERISQQASKEIITNMLGANPENLSADTRTSLYTILTQAPDSITANSKGEVGIANEVTLDIGRNTGIYDAIGVLDKVTVSMDDLQKSRDDLVLRLNSLEDATADIDFDQLRTDIVSFNKSYADFTGDYAVFSENYSNFNKDYVSFNGNYLTFGEKYDDFNNKYPRFNTNYDTWRIDYDEFQGSIANFNVTKDQLINNVTSGVNEALRTLEKNVSAASGTSVVISPIENVKIGGSIR